MAPTAATNALLDRTVLPGEHALEFYARWAVEIEEGSLRRAAASFWWRDNRQDLLRPCVSMEDILDDWDDDVHGERPEEGGPAWLDDNDLLGECTFVYEDPVMILPAEGFFAEPAHELEDQLGQMPDLEDSADDQERGEIPLAQLMGERDVAIYDEVDETELFPELKPSAWQYTTGWKGNYGTCTIRVPEATTLREALRAQPLRARVYAAAAGDDGFGGQSHFEGITVGESVLWDNFVEWENGSGKSAEFELAPPDNMRLWRLAGTAIGRLVGLLRRASERAYAPGGAGAESVKREFEALAGQHGA